MNYDPERLAFLERCDDPRRLLELLAAIHGDGGQLTNKVGAPRGTYAAEAKWYDKCAEVDRLQALERALFALLPGTRYMDEPDGGAPTLLEQLQRMAADAARYHKLRGWMSSNVQEGWQEVERAGAVAAWMGWQEADAYIDALPECTVGLMGVTPK